MREKGYKKLKIWEKAHELAIEIYKTSRGFPKEEIYVLTSQISRASFSVSLNIVEGHASNSKKEFLRFLNISNRSLVETEYLLEIVLELGFISEEDYIRLDKIREETGYLLKAFSESLKARI